MIAGSSNYNRTRYRGASIRCGKWRRQTFGTMEGQSLWWTDFRWVSWQRAWKIIQRTKGFQQKWVQMINIGVKVSVMNRGKTRNGIWPCLDAIFEAAFIVRNFEDAWRGNPTQEEVSRYNWDTNFSKEDNSHATHQEVTMRETYLCWIRERKTAEKNPYRVKKSHRVDKHNHRAAAIVVNARI